MKEPIKVVVTGAAGQIAYSLLFRIAAGEVFGADQPIVLHLLEIAAMEDKLQAVVMELDDCAYPLLDRIVTTSDVDCAFDDIDYAFLVGSRPRSAGMERKDLLQVNAEIFKVQGQALNNHAKRSAKVLVVGNPANTNALITIHNAPNLDPRNIHAMVRLDHNRALAQLAHKLQCQVRDLQHMTIWGNHSATQYPDVSQVKLNAQNIAQNLEDSWIKDTFIPTIQQRGAAVIKARGGSSAASAAHAALMHMRDWVQGLRQDDWVSMAVFSNNNPYGFADDLVCGFPCVCKNGDYTIVENIQHSEFAAKMIQKTLTELQEERDAVRALL